MEFNSQVSAIWASCAAKEKSLRAALGDQIAALRSQLEVDINAVRDSARLAIEDLKTCKRAEREIPLPVTDAILIERDRRRLEREEAEERKYQLRKSRKAEEAAEKEAERAAARKRAEQKNTDHVEMLESLRLQRDAEFAEHAEKRRLESEAEAKREEVARLARVERTKATEPEANRVFAAIVAERLQPGITPEAALEIQARAVAAYTKTFHDAGCSPPE